MTSRAPTTWSFQLKPEVNFCKNEFDNLDEIFIKLSKTRSRFQEIPIAPNPDSTITVWTGHWYFSMFVRTTRQQLHSSRGQILTRTCVRLAIRKTQNHFPGHAPKQPCGIRFTKILVTIDGLFLQESNVKRVCLVSRAHKVSSRWLPIASASCGSDWPNTTMLSKKCRYFVVNY